MKFQITELTQRVPNRFGDIASNFLGRRRKISEASTSNGTGVVVLTQFYKPEPFLFPPAIASVVAEKGSQVTVVTGYPNRPGGKIFEGYKQKFGFVEHIDSIRVRRVPLVINHSRKALERVINFMSFSISALTVTHRIKDAEVVYVYATPATAAIPAQVWRLFFGIPYVLHVQDLWPESVTDSGMMGNARLARFAEKVMAPWLRSLYGKADQLIAISPGMRDLLIERGAQPERCKVVFNWADEDTITVKPSASFGEKGLRLLYAGNIGPMQDLETVVESASRFGTETGLTLNIAGGGILEDSLKAHSEAIDNVKILGRFPRSAIGKFYLESDFQLVPLKDIPIFRTTVPSKLQASLASGVPVITTVKGDVARLIEEYDAGLVAEPEDVDSLAGAFQIALEMSAEERAMMGRNARRLYEEKMSYSAGTDAIASILVSESTEFNIENDK